MSGTISNNIGRSSGSITEPSGGVEILSSDPTLSNGLVWYNSTSNTLKVARNISAWANGGNVNTPRWQAPAGAGTLTAAVSFGGDTGTAASASYVTETEEYDGSSWTDVGGALLTAVQSHASAGTQTAALSFGGYSD